MPANLGKIKEMVYKVMDLTINMTRYYDAQERNREAGNWSRATLYSKEIEKLRRKRKAYMRSIDLIINHHQQSAS